MNIGLFGGTFDPIHLGHLALARSSIERFQLGKIYFVPASMPPHKHQPVATFFDRYAMVVLATAGEKKFIPSLLEAPAQAAKSPVRSKGQESGYSVSGVNYSIDTVRRLKKLLKASDRLFFLIGIDAFSEIATWHKAEELFHECEFIVASRPGYSLADVANALPAKGDLVLSGVNVHLLENVHSPISATTIRTAVAARKPLKKFVAPQVEEYVKKAGLYLNG